MDTDQAIADCFQKKSCNNGTVNSSGKCEKDFAVTYLFTYKSNLVCYEIGHIPIGRGLTGLEYKAL